LLLLLNDSRCLPELVGKIKAVSRHPPEGIGGVRVNTGFRDPQVLLGTSSVVLLRGHE
jgi:hypothetical protein